MNAGPMKGSRRLNPESRPASAARAARRVPAESSCTPTPRARTAPLSGRTPSPAGGRGQGEGGPSSGKWFPHPSPLPLRRARESCYRERMGEEGTRGGGRVLVADDDAAVLSLLRR